MALAGLRRLASCSFGSYDTYGVGSKGLVSLGCFSGDMCFPLCSPSSKPSKLGFLVMLASDTFCCFEPGLLLSCELGSRGLYILKVFNQGVGSCLHDKRYQVATLNRPSGRLLHELILKRIRSKNPKTPLVCQHPFAALRKICS